MPLRATRFPGTCGHKIGLFCNLPADRVIQNLNARTIYEVPLLLDEEGLRRTWSAACWASRTPTCDLTEWRAMVERQLTAPAGDHHRAWWANTWSCHDAYLSIVEALTHGGIASRCHR